jgi:hypothetical protein
MAHPALWRLLVETSENPGSVPVMGRDSSRQLPYWISCPMCTGVYTRGWSGRSVKLIIHLHPMAKSKMYVYKGCPRRKGQYSGKS